MMADAKTISVKERISAYGPQMPASLAKVAEVLLDDPRAPLDLSITELAERAGTSISSITRFCRAIGYTGYAALRVGAAEELGSGKADTVWENNIGRTFKPDDSPDEAKRVLLNDRIVSLQTTAGLLDTKAVSRAADKISRARHVDVYGVSGSALTAGEIHSRFYRMGVNIHAWDDVHNGVASAAILDSDCVAIAVSHTGRTEETIEMMARAKAAGAYCVVITGSVGSPLGKMADDVLFAAAHEGYMQPTDLTSRHCQLLVVDFLYLLVAQQNYERATRLLALSRDAVASRRRT